MKMTQERQELYDMFIGMGLSPEDALMEISEMELAEYYDDYYEYSEYYNDYDEYAEYDLEDYY